VIAWMIKLRHMEERLAPLRGRVEFAAALTIA
jgi:hypothetical protein